MNIPLPENISRIKNFSPKLPTELWGKIFKDSLGKACQLNTWFFKNIFPIHHFSFCNIKISNHKIAEIPIIEFDMNSDNVLNNLEIKYTNPFVRLPKEIILHIIMKCSIDSLDELSKVNTFFNKTITDVATEKGLSFKKLVYTRKRLQNLCNFVPNQQKHYFALNDGYDNNDDNDDDIEDNFKEKEYYPDHEEERYEHDDNYFDEDDDEDYYFVSEEKPQIVINNNFEVDDVASCFKNWSHNVTIIKK